MEMSVYKENSLGKIQISQEGMEPIYIASIDTTNVTALHLAELLSWTEMLSDHAEIMESLLPIETCQLEREQAIAFKLEFDMAYEQCLEVEVEEAAVRQLSRGIMPMAENLLAFKRDLEEMQRTGDIHTLMWPTYLAHIARENSRFLHRQRQFIEENSVSFDRSEIVTFWAEITAEHFAFVAHLLDPAENELIGMAVDQNQKFDDIRREHELVGGMDPVPEDISNVIDFEMMALKGIEAGSIASAITPLLADHVRRESILFRDELVRADHIFGIETGGGPGGSS